jgi:hypothetical protein
VKSARSRGIVGTGGNEDNSEILVVSRLILAGAIYVGEGISVLTPDEFLKPTR